MKTVRILLLVLITLLLPFRGAVAAVEHCTEEVDGNRMELRLHEHPHAGQAAASCHSADPDHATDPPGPHDPAAGMAGECSSCAASCSSSPLVNAVPLLSPPLSFTALVFPALHAPAPSFLSDGQERPPRSV